MSKIKSLNDLGAAPKTPQVQISADDLEDIICENCDGKIFREVVMVKRLSALISPTGKEQIVPVPVFRCDECGFINKEFRPVEGKTDK